MAENRFNEQFRTIEIESEHLLGVVERTNEWVDQFGDDASRRALHRQLGRIRRDLTKSKNAAQRRPSVAIFGQSQVGKSWLVHNLARPSDAHSLNIRVPGGSAVSFVDEINPEGGKESTGVVTRFTTDQETVRDKQYPFKVQLFSVTDVAAILFDAYVNDLTDYAVETIDEEQVREVIATMRAVARAQTEPVQGVTEDDVASLIEYLEESRSFERKGIFKRVGYFSALHELLPSLPTRERLQLLQFLWGGSTFLNDLFKYLIDALERIEFSSTVYVGMNALARQHGTVLDVANVQSLFGSSSDSTLSPVSLRTEGGKQFTVPRSTFAALIREVELPIEHSGDFSEAQQFLEYSDILDFPGSRSREIIPEEVFDHNEIAEKLIIFIRGKVSYLFSYYSRNFGISTLLYCMGDSQPEEMAAGERLGRWIQDNIGHSPEARKDREQTVLAQLHEAGLFSDLNTVSSLLVVFTKFDNELPKKETVSQDGHNEYHDAKWTARYEANFADFITRSVSDKWTMAWTSTDRPFDFVFPIRDPHYSQATFEGYDAEGRETALRSERRELIRIMGESFMGSFIVQRHSLDPQAIWTEITTPNGTGLHQLARSLNPSAHPVNSLARLRNALDRSVRELTGLLKPYLISGDMESDLREANKKALASTLLVQRLRQSGAGGLHEILDHMVLSESDVWHIVYDFVFAYSEDDAKEAQDAVGDGASDLIEFLNAQGLELSPTDDRERMRASIAEHFGITIDDVDAVLEDLGFSLPQPTIDASVDEAPRTNEDVFIEHVLSTWNEKLLETVHLVREGDLTESDADHLEVLVREILKGQSRFDLHGVLRDQMDGTLTGTMKFADIEMIASCTATILNRFFFSCGWRFCREDTNRPVHKKTGEALFSDTGTLNERLEIAPYQNDVIEPRFLNEWTAALKELCTENVRWAYGGEGGDVNERSQGVLKGLVESISECE